MNMNFEWAIGECEDMLKLARQNPQIMNPKQWEEKIAGLNTLLDQRRKSA